MRQHNVARHELTALGKQIRQVRITKQFSQIGFALHAGFARAYYRSIERGERNVSALNLIRLAKALGVEVGALFPPLAELLAADQADGTSEIIQVAIVDDQATDKDQAAVENERLLSAGAAARLLGVNRRTIERWAHDGILRPAALVEDQGGKFYSVFSPKDVRELAATMCRTW